MKSIFRHDLFLLLALFCLLPSSLWAEPAAVEPPQILLAETHGGQGNIADYWVSEKLDGVRAVWDGKQLRFRSGRLMAAPAWFLAGLPGHALDGELWSGRGRFEALSATVRRQVPIDREWQQVRYLVFELPGGGGSFTQRINRIREIVNTAGVSWLGAVEHFRLADRAALMRHMEKVHKSGGEGLMLHLADAPYVTGRSYILLKLKPWLDAEAWVVAHIPGQGKYAGMLGALRMKMPDGRHFNLGTGFSDAERRNPPPPGTLVSYRYRELTRQGLPRFATYWRVRPNF